MTPPLPHPSDTTTTNPRPNTAPDPRTDPGPAAGSALTLVVCGAPLASRAHDIHDALTAAGWSVTIVRSTAAADWTPPADTHHHQHRDTVVEGPKRRPDVVVACPLTFNTANKIVAGVMDTPVTGALCDALGAHTPIIAVPMANHRLWAHPTWATTLATLHTWGVALLDPTTGELGDPHPVASGTGDALAAAFDPHWILTALGPAPSCG